MSTSPSAPILNPFTPLVFLPPDEAYQKTITDYISVGGLSVGILYKIFGGLAYFETALAGIKSVYQQLHILYQGWPGLNHCLEFTESYHRYRWSTFSYIIVGTILNTAPIDDCEASTKVLCAVYHVAISSTALLFFFRVRAIFNRNIHIVIGFFALWVVVLGASLGAVMSTTGVHIGNTKYCAFYIPRPYRSAIANSALAAFDTCVFIAITWNLSGGWFSISHSDTLTSKSRLHPFSQYLPTFSKALIQDGQKYYMVAMISNLLVVILTFAPRIPMAYRCAFLAPVAGLTNIMACRVFRHTKMKYKSEDICSVSMSTIAFQEGKNEIPTPLFIPSQMRRGNSSIITDSVTESTFHDLGSSGVNATSSAEKLGRISGEKIESSV